MSSRLDLAHDVFNLFGRHSASMLGKDDCTAEWGAERRVDHRSKLGRNRSFCSNSAHHMAPSCAWPAEGFHISGLRPIANRKRFQIHPESTQGAGPQPLRAVRACDSQA